MGLPKLPNWSSFHLKRVEWTLVRALEVAEGMETEMVTTEDLNRVVSTLRIVIPSARMLGTLLVFALCMLLKDVIYIYVLLCSHFHFVVVDDKRLFELAISCVEDGDNIINCECPTTSENLPTIGRLTYATAWTFRCPVCEMRFYNGGVSA
jgi:hypothetical protein